MSMSPVAAIVRRRDGAVRTAERAEGEAMKHEQNRAGRNGQGTMAESATGLAGRLLSALVVVLALVPPAAQAYSIEWRPDTAAFYGADILFFDSEASGSSSSTQATGSSNIDRPRDGTLAMAGGSLNLVASGGVPGGFFRHGIAHWWEVQFAVRKTAPAEIPLAYLQTNLIGFGELSAFPATAGVASGDYVQLLARSYVHGTGLSTGDVGLLLDRAADDGLGLAAHFEGRDTELLAVDTWYTWHFETQWIVSREWDGQSARYGSAELEYATANLALVPEPSIAVLMASGLSMLAFAQRRRRRDWHPNARP